jgi:hypothetical protein
MLICKGPYWETHKDIVLYEKYMGLIIKKKKHNDSRREQGDSIEKQTPFEYRC